MHLCRSVGKIIRPNNIGLYFDGLVKTYVIPVNHSYFKIFNAINNVDIH